MYGAVKHPMYSAMILLFANVPHLRLGLCVSDLSHPSVSSDETDQK